MTDQDEEDSFPRALKRVSTNAIEAAISDALAKLVGVAGYEVEILDMDFHPEENSFLHDVTELRIRFRRHFDVRGIFRAKAPPSS